MGYVPRTTFYGVSTSWASAANRPTNPNHGQVGLNEATGNIEVYDSVAAAWRVFTVSGASGSGTFSALTVSSLSALTSSAVTTYSGVTAAALTATAATATNLVVSTGVSAASIVATALTCPACVIAAETATNLVVSTGISAASIVGTALTCPSAVVAAATHTNLVVSTAISAASVLGTNISAANMTANNLVVGTGGVLQGTLSSYTGGTATSAAQTMSAGNTLLAFTASTNDYFALPAPAVGLACTPINRVGSTAALIGNAATQSIDGATSKLIATSGAAGCAPSLICDGTNWWRRDY